MKLFKKWIKDYNYMAPHFGLGMKSLVKYRNLMDRFVWKLFQNLPLYDRIKL